MVRRAVISVSNKDGIVDFARTIIACGFEILSTGGTARTLRAGGLQVTDVSEYTGAPEILDGRVKTLHPKIHGGLLYIRGNPEHEATLAREGISPIDLVVVDLYPVEIDIGGVTLIRAAAKNFESVTVVTGTEDYERVSMELAKFGDTTLETRTALAQKAFIKTAAYDADIAKRVFGAEVLAITAPKVQTLRYGENPHQQGALYGAFSEFYEQLQGKELSYNNILDLSAAVGLIREFENEAPTVVIIKHTNACGVGQGGNLSEAWAKAFATDVNAPFGGIVAVNTELDGDAARIIAEIFTEIVIAPGFSKEALQIFSAKKNVRLIRVKKDPCDRSPQIRSVGAGSYVVQDPDVSLDDTTAWKVVSKRVPTEAEMKGMHFVWRVAKHIKSNAIVFGAVDRTLGVGAGQMSRIDSTRIAIQKAKDAGLDLRGSVVASDAFFPFADGLIAAVEGGATAVVEPGGSIKDAEVIAAADERGVALVFTGTRHFRH